MIRCPFCGIRIKKKNVFVNLSAHIQEICDNITDEEKKAYNNRVLEAEKRIKGGVR